MSFTSEMIFVDGFSNISGVIDRLRRLLLGPVKSKNLVFLISGIPDILGHMVGWV